MKSRIAAVLLIFILVICCCGIGIAESDSANGLGVRQEITTDYGTFYITIQDVSILESDYWRETAVYKSDDTVIIAIRGIVENESFVAFDDERVESWRIADHMEVLDQDGFTLEFLNISGAPDGKYQVCPDVKKGSKTRACYPYYANSDITSVTLKFSNGQTITVSLGEDNNSQSSNTETETVNNNDAVTVAAPAEETSSNLAYEGINLQDLSTLSDEELEAAYTAILQEKRNRLHIELVIAPHEASIKKGTTQKLEATLSNLPDDITAGKPVWSSSDENIATVSSTGTVQGVHNGDAVITCTYDLSDGSVINAECAINVYVPVLSVKSATPKVTLQMNQTQKLDFTFQPADATVTKLSFASSDSSIVSVDENGDITAVGGGKATVTATTTDGTNKATSVEVYVPSLAGAETLVIDEMKTSSGDIIRPVEYTFTYYGKGEVKVKSSSPRLFSCSLSTGNENELIVKVTPKRAGTGKITITDGNDAKSNLVVNVTITDKAVYPEIRKGTAALLSNGQTINIKSLSFAKTITHKMYKIRKQYDWDASSGDTYVQIKASNGNKTGGRIRGKDTVTLWCSFDGGSTVNLPGFPTDYNNLYPTFFQRENTDYISDGSSIEMMYFTDVSESKKNCKDVWIYIKDSSYNTIGICYYKENLPSN